MHPNGRLEWSLQLRRELCSFRADRESRPTSGPMQKICCGADHPIAVTFQPDLETGVRAHCLVSVRAVVVETAEPA